jgi:hypothetical protein
MQSPRPSQLCAFLWAARLAAIAEMGDQSEVLVEHARLDGWPGHVNADLLSRDAAQQIGGRGEEAEDHVGDGGGLAVHELDGERGRVAEVEDEGAAGRDGDQEPGQVGRRLLPDLLEVPGARVEADARVAVALPEALDHDHEIGPHRLRARVAAPHAPGERGDEEEPKRRQDQKARDVVELLRPDLDGAEEEALVGEVEEEGLVRQARSTVPADPGQQIIDAERDGHHRPLDLAEGAVRELGVDLLARGIGLAHLLRCHRGDVDPLDPRRCLCRRSLRHEVGGSFDHGHARLPPASLAPVRLHWPAWHAGRACPARAGATCRRPTNARRRSTS